MAHQKTIEIRISQTDLETLKNSGYKLCSAKKVNDTYAVDVVWQSSSDYLECNDFSWTTGPNAVYQLFGTDSVPLDTGTPTNAIYIKLGESATLDVDRVLQDSVTSDGKPTSITLVNEYGSIRPGLSQSSTGIDGKMTVAPIYVGDTIVKGSQAALMPMEYVKVWFETTTAKSYSIEIDMTDVDSASYTYSNQEWTKTESDS
eukprot:m.259064 g.259064  ORF g.259064 m.259064 type:complete len:202 (+) comp37542_c0_seq1:175-780(+)